MMQTTVLTNDQLRELTGYKRGGDQARWVREQLNLTPAVAADGRPRLTTDALTAALLAKGSAVAGPQPSAQSAVLPKWRTAA